MTKRQVIAGISVLGALLLAFILWPKNKVAAAVTTAQVSSMAPTTIESTAVTSIGTTAGAANQGNPSVAAQTATQMATAQGLTAAQITAAASQAIAVATGAKYYPYTNAQGQPITRAQFLATHPGWLTTHPGF